MKNKTNYILMLVVTLVLGALFGAMATKNGGEVPEESKSGLTVQPFDEKLLSNRALLVVQKGQHLPETEEVLRDMAEKHAVEVSKVEYDGKFEAFVKNQEKIVNDNYPLIAKFNEKLTSQTVGKSEEEVQAEDLKYNEVLNSMKNSEDVTKEIEGLAKDSDSTVEEVKNYLEARLKLSEMKLLRPIVETDAPLLVLFDEEKEFDRINALNQDRDSLAWLLTTKGMFNLSRTESLKALSDISSKEEKMVVVFGTSTCVYCRNTSPLVEKIAKDENIPYHYVDIRTFVNEKDFARFYEEGILKEVVENTPTIVLLEKGKEVNRYVGELPALELQRFLTGKTEASDEEMKK